MSNYIIFILECIWSIIYFIFIKPFPSKLLSKFYIFLVNIFGGNVSYKATIYSSAKIKRPWKLIMKENSCLGPFVDCYNIDFVILYENSIVSQKSYLCTASHNIDSTDFILVHKPIVIHNNAWVGAYSYINRGVIIHEYAVVGAYSAVFKSVKSYEVVGGNPSKFLKMRNRYKN